MAVKNPTTKGIVMVENLTDDPHVPADETPDDKPLYGYIGLYQGRRTEIYAENLLAAKLRALDHFKPSKSRRHQVSVHLAEMPDGRPVTQVITN